MNTVMTRTEKEIAMATRLLARMSDDATDNERAEYLMRGMALDRADASVLVMKVKEATGETPRAAPSGEDSR